MNDDIRHVARARGTRCSCEAHFTSKFALAMLLGASVYIGGVAGALAKSKELNAGIAALDAGNNKLAVSKLSSAINAKTLKGPDVAKALYYRGLALGRVNRHGQAIADLTGALWLSGLSADERAKAYAARAVSYDATGLKAQAAADRKKAGGAATAAAKKPAAASETAAAAPAPKLASPAKVATGPTTNENGDDAAIDAGGGGTQSSGDPITSFFTSLFGGGSSSSPATPAQKTKAAKTPEPASAAPEAKKVVEIPAKPAPTAAPARRASNATPAKPAKPSQTKSAAPAQQSWEPSVVAAKEETPPAQADPVTSFFTSLFGGGQAPAPKAQTPPKSTRVAALDSGQVSTASPTAVKPAEKGSEKLAPAKKRLKGRYLVQLASVRSRSEAARIVSDLRKRYPKMITAQNTQIDQTVIGNMGRFHRVVLGPYKTAAAGQKACAALLKAGQDCFALNR